MASVVFVSSYLCGGKSTYCQDHLSDYKRISVSDVIKTMIGKDTRKELQDTADLDVKIAATICTIIAKDLVGKVKVVVDGIRQPSIYGYIKQWCDELELGTKTIWLEVPIGVCKQRFDAKNDGKENISFIQAFQRDADLGLLDLEKFWKENNCTIINN